MEPQGWRDKILRLMPDQPSPLMRALEDSVRIPEEEVPLHFKAAPIKYAMVSVSTDDDETLIMTTEPILKTGDVVFNEATGETIGVSLASPEDRSIIFVARGLGDSKKSPITQGDKLFVVGTLYEEKNES